MQWVLTPNNRLSRQYIKDTAQKSCDIVEISVTTPNIWCQQRYEELLLKGHVDWQILSPQQELWLWQQVLIEHDVINLNATAKLCQGAWQLVWEYQLIDYFEQFEDSQSQQFVLWFQTFSNELTKRSFRTQSQLPNVMLEAFQNNQLTLPHAITCFDFDEWPRVWQTLFGYFQQQKVPVEHQKANHEIGSANIVKAENLEQELRLMFSYAKEQLENWQTNQQLNDKKIALIIPDMNAMQQQVQKLALCYFDHDQLQNTQANKSPVINITASEPLANTPIIKAALNALNINRANFDINLVLQFLASPFISPKVEVFHEYLLNQQKGSWNGAALINAVRAIEHNAFKGEPQQLGLLSEPAPCLSQSLTNMQNLRPKGNQLPSFWADLFNRQLATLGWPGDFELNSIEYQQTSQWPLLLASLSQFDDLCGLLSISDALNLLNQLAAQHAFHPQSPDSPLQIMGLLEAKGMRFDKAWVMSMDQSRWPSASKPNPFIPLWLQKEHNLPHCSNEREYQYALNFTQALKQLAPEVIFSYSALESYAEQHLSPLLTDISLVAKQAVNDDVHQLLWQSEATTQCQISEKVPLVNPKLPAGSYYLKQFAQCPFKAFAQYRLKARPLPIIEPGFNAKDKGIVIHDVLAKLWLQIGSSERLTNLSTEDLLTQIEQVTQDVLHKYCRQFSGRFGQTLIDIEQHRLVELLSLWFEFERTRPSFKVTAIEKSVSLQILDTQISMNCDRIDQTEEGHTVVDYKTGNITSMPWFNDPIKDPQLPLYALATQSKGIAFARINAKQQDLLGVGTSELSNLTSTLSRSRSPWKNDVDDWPMLIEKWHSLIEQSVNLVQDGDLSLAQNPNACTQCEMQTICRKQSSLL